MSKVVRCCAASAALVVVWLASSGSGLAQDQFSDYVQPDGTIDRPTDFRNWPYLGTWAVAAEERPGASDMHVVYASPGTVEAYQETGEFPDGAVLVKELFATETADMTTGTVSRQANVNGWFVMIKDAEGRFPDNPLWGDGWGWALFPADSPDTTVTTDYEADCLGCHVPAQDTDWVYVQGYPVLHE